MQRISAALVAALLTAVIFTGCSARENTEQEDGKGVDGAAVSQSAPAFSQEETDLSAPGVAPASPQTDLRAKEYNAQIDEASLELIQFAAPGASEKTAVIGTTEGEIRIRLFPDQAPKTVENFVALAQSGAYNGLTFHRVVQDLLIQGGDPNGDGTGGKSSFSTGEEDPGYFEDEFNLNLWHFRGALAMAHVSDQADTNASQFFIVQNSAVSESRIAEMEEIKFPQKVIEQYKLTGGAPHLDWKYTVFGMVADEESLAVVDKIAAVKVESETFQPVESVLIESITIQ